MSASNLLYAYAKGWIPLPSWANFLVHLGSDASATASESPDRRMVVALALPTRAYAAALCAAGVVMDRAGLDDDTEQLVTHFNRIASLPLGTGLTYTRGDRTFPSRFAGTSTYVLTGEPCLVVQTGKAGRLTEQVPISRSMAVSIAEKQDRRLPTNPTGRQVQVQAAFLKRWIAGVDPLRFATKTELDCVLIGNVLELLTEITQTTFGARSGETVARGTLQEILRVKGVPRAGEGYRCKLVTTREGHRPAVGEHAPPFAIFDGARGFLRHRDSWRDSHWIVLLDRTDPHFREAVDVLNSGYITRAGGDDPSLQLHGIPRGAAIQAYWEVR